MKSVVVEASTVAKAIETAWLKADKPEEFFIRVLQEHSSGFLGFGATKAKIVFFFKNTKKSDSLFPVVVKQKEYANFFGNSHLKVPAQLDFIDSELNKNVVLGSQQKKKQHNKNKNAKQNNQHSEAKSAHNHGSHGKLVENSVTQKAVLHKVPHTSKNVQAPILKTVKGKNTAIKSLVDTKSEKNSIIAEQPVRKQKLKVSLQAPEFAKDIIAKKSVSVSVDEKNDVVKDVAKVLKKIQTKKIISNVSRPTQKSKFATQKFETYDDFINSTTGIPAEKDVVRQEISAVIPKIEKVLKEEFVTSASQKTLVDTPQVTVDIKNIDKTKSATNSPTVKRAPLKFKRRPLTTENPGVSGIVRSAEKKISENVKNDDVKEDDK